MRRAPRNSGRRPRQIASALGMTVLLEKTAATGGDPPAPSMARATPAASALRSRRRQTPAGNLFRRDGEYWTVRYDGALFSLRDTKGMQYLARLLAAPGVEFHALDLVERRRRAGSRTGRDDLTRDRGGARHDAASVTPETSST